MSEQHLLISQSCTNVQAARVAAGGTKVQGGGGHMVSGLHIFRDACRCCASTGALQELRAQHFPLYPPSMYAGKPLFTGDKEPSMVLNITQLLGPLDWEETTVELEDGTLFKHMAARDLKRLRCCTSVPCPSYVTL